MKTATITLEDVQQFAIRMGNGKKPDYIVSKLVNSVDFSINQGMTKRDVQDLINNPNWTVNIVPYKGRKRR